MIHVDRTRVPPPRELQWRWKQEFTKAMEFYKDPDRHQRRFPFKAYKLPAVREALNDLFYGKCAYCESMTVHVAPMDIYVFRPKGGVIDKDGTNHPDHYWWLAGEWENLYPSCINCNRRGVHDLLGGSPAWAGKGRMFPIEGERAPLLTPHPELHSERPLLLDPCADEPERHLLFKDDGTVVPQSVRGQATIDILGLNRVPLVEARHDAAMSLLTTLSGLTGLKGEKLALVLRDYTHGRAEFAGMKRRLIRTWVSRLRPASLPSLLARLELPEQTVSPAAQRAKQRKMQKLRAEQAEYALETGDNVERYRLRKRMISRLAIDNIGPIRKLRLDLTQSTFNGTPWAMMVGENATGKSTILKAIALTLVGKEYLAKLVESLSIDLGGMVRHGFDKGTIKVYLSGFAEPHTLVLHRDGRVEHENSEHAQVILLAYGSTRLMARHGVNRPEIGKVARVENLFDPLVPLVGAKEWMLRLDDDTFHFTARALREVLPLRKNDYLSREGDEVSITRRPEETIARLSDGYRTVISLIADVLEVVFRLFPTPESAHGLMLIDEIGSHLHPTWKMRLVTSLRSVLPGLQVIATTHEPLCLRGMADGELCVLQRGPRGGISLVSDLPSIKGMRVDQLLTSEHFGLASTLDPALHEALQEYYAQLRRPKSRRDEDRVTELKKQIESLEVLGKTQRERLMLEAIDKYLAQRPRARSKATRQRLKKSTMEKIAAMWHETPA